MQVSSILKELNKYWPSYDGPNDEFWTHEYEKHGTCAEQLAPLKTELDFFTQAVNLAQKYNPVNFLAAAGITPGSGTVSKSSFDAAIKSGFGGTPFTDCSSGQLTGMGLCLDKTLAPMDCPSNLESTCSSDFSFPSSQ